jgi:hypothetical protein
MNSLCRRSYRASSVSHPALILPVRTAILEKETDCLISPELQTSWKIRARPRPLVFRPLRKGLGFSPGCLIISGQRHNFC